MHGEAVPAPKRLRRLRSLVHIKYYRRFGTKVSGTIVSSGEYRRSRDPLRNPYRRRIQLRRSGYLQRILIR